MKNKDLLLIALVGFVAYNFGSKGTIPVLNTGGTKAEPPVLSNTGKTIPSGKPPIFKPTHSSKFLPCPTCGSTQRSFPLNFSI